MTLLNISLCLPALDIVALQQKRSIVAVTKRFIAPGRTFALLPCRDFPGASDLESCYQADFLVQSAAASLGNEAAALTHWASCVSVQQLSDESAIAALAARTIWTAENLLQHLQDQKRLFLCFLQVHALPEALDVETEPACEHLYKFMPLPRHLEVSTATPLLSTQDLATAKERFLNPVEEDPEPEPAELEDTINVIDTADWFTKIAEIGHSSDGYTFEKLVRKGLIELGFSNSRDSSAASSLDPKATGGASGLDFYADQPYKIVGECKASSKKKINTDAATQLVRLGLQNLSVDEYTDCIKVVVSAGELTSAAEQIAQGHCINVIRPRTFQSLIELKLKYKEAIELSDLGAYLKVSPFGIEANEKIQSLVQQWESEFKQKEQYIQQRSQVIQTIKELSEQPIHVGKGAFVTVEVRAHYNARYQPCISDEAAKDMLKELASPLSGYLGRKQLPGDQERFYFVRDMMHDL